MENTPISFRSASGALQSPVGDVDGPPWGDAARACPSVTPCADSEARDDLGCDVTGRVVGEVDNDIVKGECLASARRGPLLLHDPSVQNNEPTTAVIISKIRRATRPIKVQSRFVFFSPFVVAPLLVLFSVLTLAVSPPTRHRTVIDSTISALELLLVPWSSILVNGGADRTDHFSTRGFTPSPSPT